MPKTRLVYQNWIADLGLDPAQIKKFFDVVKIDTGPDDEINQEVRRALEGLEKDEMEFVIRFYFMGESYSEISEETGRAVHNLESLHTRAIRKLRNRLKAFVKKRYRIKPKQEKPCPLCDPAFRTAINEIIANKDKKTTWRPILKLINKLVTLKIKSPQVLITHEKYHGGLGAPTLTPPR